MIGKRRVQRGTWWVRGLKILISLLFGGLFYSIWLVVFLISTSDEGFMNIILWVLAPVVTGFGFALGIYFFERISKGESNKFWSIYLWPLVGCILGAGVVYWFGPMLIVFSMLTFGTLSIALREYIHG